MMWTCGTITQICLKTDPLLRTGNFVIDLHCIASSLRTVSCLLAVPPDYKLTHANISTIGAASREPKLRFCVKTFTKTY
jgi:hypothetical protein